MIDEILNGERKRFGWIVSLVVGFSTSLLLCCSAARIVLADDPVILVPQEEELYACQRGCRLFSICQFVGESEDLNQTKAECESSKKTQLNDRWYRYCSGFQLCTHMTVACLNNKRLWVSFPIIISYYHLLPPHFCSLS